MPYYDEGDSYPDRRFRQGGNPLLPPEAIVYTISSGWLNGIGTFYGSVAHANTGSSAWGAYNVFLQGNAHARVVDYSSGVVVWHSTWEPVSGGAAPTVTPNTNYNASGVQVNMGNEFGPISAGAGMLTLYATVDGVETDRIILTIGDNDGFYPLISWGPAP